MKRDAPATHRNREPILAELARWLTGPTRVLEVASGTGQHAAFFAERLPQLDWQPSEADAEDFASIDAWSLDAKDANVRAPVALDATEDPWPFDEGAFDALFNANMIHISPWSVAEGLFRGAGRVLRSGGLCFVYGPFKIGGEHTAESNAAFDENLRARDPSWGVRDLERVVETAATNGFEHVETNDLPSNNKLVVFRRADRR